MTLFFPDVNVWLALSDPDHIHSKAAWKWLKTAPEDRNIVFSRFTHLGLLRLLTNASVMGDRTMTLSKAWGVYDKWLEDPRVKFYPEPRNLDAAFRKMTEAFAAQPATKAVGDCFLLAYAKEVQATLVTFDQGLDRLARKYGHGALIPA